MAVFVDFYAWEMFDDNVEVFREVFGAALTLQSLVGEEPHYPMRHVAEEEVQLGALYELVFATTPAAAAGDATTLMRELFTQFPEPGRHVQLLQLPTDSLMVTVLHVGLVRINVPGSREVRWYP